MSSALAGSLHTSSFADVMAWLARDQRTGLLRIRHSGPEGAARGELVLANGLLVGGAVYRAGGFKGTGDALVEAALCSPEDAQGALEYAAQTAEYVPGTLADGASRAGVSIERVEEALRDHLRWVFKTLSGWRAGSWEFLLEGLPTEAADRDSAAARAFLLDRGLDPAALDGLAGDLSRTLEEKAAQVEDRTARDAQDPDVTRRSKAVQAAPPAQRLDDAAERVTNRSSGTAVPPGNETVSPPAMDTEPDFKMPEALATPPVSDFVDPGESAVFAEPPAVENAPPERPPRDAPATVAETAASAEPAVGVLPAASDFADPTATGELVPAPEDLEPPEEEPSRAPGEPVAPPMFDAPGSLPDEPTPGVHDGSPSPVFETPEGDLSGEHELDAPEPPPPAQRIPIAGPAPSSLGEADLFADADDSSPEAEAEPPPLAAEAPAGSSDPGEDGDAGDEPTLADPPPAGEIDWSAPGGAEAALMEAETLLDSEVLSVMLEMGNSAAATATAAPGTERILTGHVLLADEEGQITGVVLAVPLREAGYVVHIVRGLDAADAALDRAVNDGQKPLVIADLLLKKGEGGMMGGLDLVARASALGVPSILLGEAGDDARARAEEAGVAAILARPLRSDLKDEATRKAFVETVLAAVDAHRPRPEWSTPGEGPAEALDTGGPGAAPEEGGWDVQEIEKKAEEVEDLPDFGMIDPEQRMDSLWRETVASLSGPLTRTEILLQVLRFGAETLNRAVLFTPNSKGELSGFGQFGIELAPGVDADDAVRHIRFPIDAHPAVTQAIQGRHAVRSKPGTTEWEGHLTMSLGGITPEEVFLGPVFCRGRLAALLYGDTLPNKSALPDTTNLEVVLGQAGLALDRAELEARIAALERKD